MTDTRDPTPSLDEMLTRLQEIGPRMAEVEKDLRTFAKCVNKRLREAKLEILGACSKIELERPLLFEGKDVGRLVFRNFRKRQRPPPKGGGL